jgi:hypothetical protein
MGDYGIVPEERPDHIVDPPGESRGIPEIGEIEEGETAYTTSLSEVFGGIDDDVGWTEVFGHDSARMREWWDEIEAIIRAGGEPRQHGLRRAYPRWPTELCAWYKPIHFFGHDWGIYIREQCILMISKEIARFVDWTAFRRSTAPISSSPPFIARQLLRSAFYVFYLHEHFHHKVESLGFRFLISTKSDRYRPYKLNVYSRVFNTSGCTEETLANADSYRRLSEPRYSKRIDENIRRGLRRFLKESFKWAPPGYAQALNSLSRSSYRNRLQRLQSQILEGVIAPKLPANHWSVASNMILSLMDVTDDIYVILPTGAQPIFTPTTIDPGWVTSSHSVEIALTRHYGYQVTMGGKGSHVKLSKPGAATIVIPGNRPVLSPGILKHVLNSIGGFPISRLKDFLDGTLVANP